MSQSASLLAHGVLGRAVCGAAIGLGRRFLSLDATLLVHAVIAPLAFGLLSWHHFGRFPSVSPLGTALGLLGVVVTLDSLVVAPFIEHSYAMFRSVLGTWLPFALIVAASYSVGRAMRQQNLASGNAGLPKRRYTRHQSGRRRISAGLEGRSRQGAGHPGRFGARISTPHPMLRHEDNPS